LPAVERFRLSSKVDYWVVKNAFNWLEQNTKYWQSLVVSINLSADSITDAQFVENIITCFQSYGFPADAICFEITETAAIANMSDAIKLVARLRSQGFIISLDDFGKGFSTFSYLKNLPAQYIKIDGSYVKNILDDKCDFAIVSSINALAKSLGMETIAEFVQCDESQKVLREVGVDFVQGYGIDKPTALKHFCLP
jgi:EAL domain-containing protein (putative c-di-GMP-specific phosphodiesterase class I)